MKTKLLGVALFVSAALLASAQAGGGFHGGGGGGGGGHFAGGAARGGGGPSFGECRAAVLAVARHSVRCRCEVSAVIE